MGYSVGNRDRRLPGPIGTALPAHPDPFFRGMAPQNLPQLITVVPPLREFRPLFLRDRLSRFFESAKLFYFNSGQEFRILPRNGRGNGKGFRPGQMRE